MTRHHIRDPKRIKAAQEWRNSQRLQKWLHAYTPLLRVWLGPVPLIVVTRSTVAREVCIAACCATTDLSYTCHSQPNLPRLRVSLALQILGVGGPLNKSNMYKYIMPWLGEGLLTASDAKWKQRRSL